MKPPRFPGTEKFRFCDKKYDQNKSLDFDSNQTDSKVISNNKLLRKNSFFFSLRNRCLSNESLMCSCMSDHSHGTNMFTNVSSSCTLEGMISQTNLPMTRLEHNKRKPNLPISSRITSRMFTLTNYDYLSHLESHEDLYYRSKREDVYEHATNDSSLLLPRHLFAESFDCSLCRSHTPNRMENSKSPSLKLSECLHSVDSLRHNNSHLTPTKHRMVNCTSHTSLLSNESSTSIASNQRTECDDSLRSSCSSSPVEHWAKNAVVSNRFSTSSHLSWENMSCLTEMT